MSPTCLYLFSLCEHAHILTNNNTLAIFNYQNGGLNNDSNAVFDKERRGASHGEMVPMTGLPYTTRLCLWFRWHRQRTDSNINGKKNGCASQNF